MTEQTKKSLYDGLLEMRGGRAILLDLMMEGDRETGESLICDFLPGMRAKYDEVKRLISEAEEKEKSNTC